MVVLMYEGGSMEFVTSIGQIILANNPTGYQLKDAQKFMECNKLISRGIGSSGWYAEICRNQCNVGVYDAQDCVGISVNGNRKGRVKADEVEILKAAEAGVTFVTDNAYHRSRQFNVGEREVAALLKQIGYEEIGRGLWVRK